MLCEGNRIRATSRTTGAAINTVVKLLADAGNACIDFQDTALVNLPCTKIQCDEIWSFVYSKQKNVPEERQGQLECGDVWTWAALCADTKIVPCWAVGRRDFDTALDFMNNLSTRLTERVQLTTDGNRAYIEAVRGAFGSHVIDYAMLQKIYGNQADQTTPERKYSPSECIDTEKLRIFGAPAKDDGSTSYVERQNLTMRMSMRRFTRLTNGSSKKLENHMHAISLFYMYYNFARPHQTLKCRTPAQAAGVANHVWTFHEIAELASSN